MDRNYYALNYQPEAINYGQSFLYDGVHDFNYWKELNKEALENKKLTYNNFYPLYCTPFLLFTIYLNQKFFVLLLFFRHV